MKPNMRLLLGNLIFLLLMGLNVYYTWIGKMPKFWGILLIIFLLFRWPSLFASYRKSAVDSDTYSMDLQVKTISSHQSNSEFVLQVLNDRNVIDNIKNDLRKTEQIGYREVWRLGLITPDQDWFDPNPDSAPQQERTKRYFNDKNYRYKWIEQIPLKRVAALHSIGNFNIQTDNILIFNGIYKYGGLPRWNYRLRTILNPGEYIRIRNIQIDTSRQHAENRSPSLARFLREDGFPLQENYADGDPLTAERGGVIVFHQGRVLVAYPKYLTQRRLIDDEGNLVDLGIDEGFGLGDVIQVKMRPAVLGSLVEYASSNGYMPILRYHSVPYASDLMLPIVDAPISISGWADLFIDTRGKGKLFISKENELSEWYEMMSQLRQLFYDELARHDYHLLGLTKDKSHLNEYLSRKMDILRDYYHIQDWCLV
jgi:hypothetical protein